MSTTKGVAVRTFTAAHCREANTWRLLDGRTVAVTKTGRATQLLDSETPEPVQKGDRYPADAGLVLAFPALFEVATTDADGLPLGMG